MRGIDRVNSQRLFFKVEVSIIRGHRFKVRESLREMRRGSFSRREWWVPGTRCQRRWWKQAH